jgi:hypothetical protein
VVRVERVEVFVDLEHVFAGVLGHPPEPGALLGDPAVDEVEVLLRPDGHYGHGAEAVEGLLEHCRSVDHAVLLVQAKPIGDDGDEFPVAPERELVAVVGAGRP